jgi:signal transduction histidine kinase
MISEKTEAQKISRPFQEDKSSVDHQVIYNFLEKEFQDTFMDELVPGIVHNFANPLNGIMGRARLLQRRLMEIMKNVDVIREPSHEENNKKLVYDVDSIVRESDRLSNILQCVTGKFCAVSDKTIQRINLSDFVELEMKFLDFYLEFKHNIKKILDLERELPDIKGSPADYSLALSVLIRYSMNSMRESASKELYVSTQFKNGYVCLNIRNQGFPIPEDSKRQLEEDLPADISSFDPNGDKGLTCAFLLLKKWGAHCEIRREAGFNEISVLIPPR